VEFVSGDANLRYRTRPPGHRIAFLMACLALGSWWRKETRALIRITFVAIVLELVGFMVKNAKFAMEPGKKHLGNGDAEK